MGFLRQVLTQLFRSRQYLCVEDNIDETSGYADVQALRRDLYLGNWEPARDALATAPTPQDRECLYQALHKWGGPPGLARNMDGCRARLAHRLDLARCAFDRLGMGSTECHRRR
jgi:hypothetical protein